MASTIPKHLNKCPRLCRCARKPASSRLSCPASGEWGGSSSTTIAHAVEMHFNLPYRTDFGQSLSIVGSTDDFGAWDVSTRVPMEWSDGDVWKAKVVADSAAVEYKYVIVEGDGTVAQWKPGGNFEVNIEGFSGQVHIEDTWDGVHQVFTALPPGASEEQAIEADQSRQSVEAEQARQAIAAEQARQAMQTEPARPAIGVEQVQQAAADYLGSAAEDSDSEDAEEELALASSSGEFDDVLRAALQQTYGELQETLETSLELADGAAPDDPRLLMNDQKLAAVHRRATSLSRAISAGAPPPAYILKEIEKSIGDGDSPQNK